MDILSLSSQSERAFDAIQRVSILKLAIHTLADCRIQFENTLANNPRSFQYFANHFLENVVKIVMLTLTWKKKYEILALEDLL